MRTTRLISSDWEARLLIHEVTRHLEACGAEYRDYLNGTRREDGSHATKQKVLQDAQDHLKVVRALTENLGLCFKIANDAYPVRMDREYKASLISGFAKGLVQSYSTLLQCVMGLRNRTTTPELHTIYMMLAEAFAPTLTEWRKYIDDNLTLASQMCTRGGNAWFPISFTLKFDAALVNRALRQLESIG